MKIITVHFNYDTYGNKYDRLLSVFLRSAEHHIPHIPIEVIRIPEPTLGKRRHRGLTANTVKLRLQEEALKKSEGNVMLMDCDMMFLGDPSDAFEQDFDIGYIKRRDRLIPINGGMIFVKVNERSLEFFEKYREVNDNMYEIPEFHQKYRGKYHGMNQSAFGYMLEKYEGDAKVLDFPAEIYDSCDDTWHTAMDKAKAVHIKGKLRRLVFDNGQPKRMYSHTVRRRRGTFSTHRNRRYVRERNEGYERLIKEWQKWDGMKGALRTWDNFPST